MRYVPASSVTFLRGSRDLEEHSPLERARPTEKFLPPRFVPPAAAAEFALRSAPRRRRLHLSQMLGLLPAATPGAALHVVFSAECTPLFDWHSVGLFYSFYASGQHGNITRLLACSEAEQAKYPKANLEIGPTFVHRNMRDDPLVDEKGYPSYNKPYSVMSWLAATKINEDYVLMLDADMVMRQPIEPTSLGARRGNVVSAEYTYLYGTTNGFTERFIPKKLQRRLAQVGGFHIFHKEDLRAISPLWLEYTKKVRAFGHKEPDTFFRESMWLPADTPESTKSVRRKQAMWHSEMYGYVFAAALVGVTHRVRRDVMLYPGYQPFLGAPPAILHYGSDYTTVGNAYFNKMMHTELHLDRCPNFLFPDPRRRQLDARLLRRPLEARRPLRRAPRPPQRCLLRILPKDRLRRGAHAARLRRRQRPPLL